MKNYWRNLAALLIGAGVMLGPCALAGWARANPSSQGHGRGKHEDRDKHDKGRGHHEHWDNGRHRGWYKDHGGRYRFDDDYRRVAVGYYRDHRDERWFRERGPRVALAFGYVVEPRYRGYCHPLPVAMVEELPPPPPRYHYYLFSGNVVLLDDGYRVQDFIQLNVNIGR